jgi:DNA modification methylase
MTSYANIHPIDTPIPASRQSAKRHYGVHPYFTRRPYNVVRRYILRYSYDGDRILDPFGGSGVTAIEAFLENRTGIHNDINPLANFIAQGIADLHQGNISSYRSALSTVQDQCENKLREIGTMSDKQLSRLLRSLPLPPNIKLPSNSDVENYYDLFQPQQLAALALLRKSVDSLRDRYPRRGMLLAWSATLAKLNKTFLSAEGRLESRGGSSVFSIYRFKVAKHPISLPPWKTFYERALNVIEAKEEIDKAIELKHKTNGWHGQFEKHEKDIEELSKEFREEVDYIFTDPPYGGHISYLDLSLLWNVWLGDLPSHKAREKELIVGGELNLKENRYIERLGRSISACAAMLKPGRWMSVVFQHWNISYFEAILRAAAESGLELRAAISQVGDPIWSMHKKKSNESVLAGEMILTFYRSGNKQRLDEQHSFDVERVINKLLGSIKSRHVYGEFLFNKLVIEAWKSGSIKALNITKSEFSNLLKKLGWNYEKENHYWTKGDSQNGLPFI